MTAGAVHPYSGTRSLHLGVSLEGPCLQPLGGEEWMRGSIALGHCRCRALVRNTQEFWFTFLAFIKICALKARRTKVLLKFQKTVTPSDGAGSGQESHQCVSRRDEGKGNGIP